MYSFDFRRKLTVEKLDSYSRSEFHWFDRNILNVRFNKLPTFTNRTYAYQLNITSFFLQLKGLEESRVVLEYRSFYLNSIVIVQRWM